jgi:hypothetical protein
VQKDATILTQYLGSDLKDTGVMSFRINLLLEHTGHGDMKIDPPLTAEEAKKVAAKTLEETKAISENKPGHSLDNIANIIKNRGNDDAGSNKDHAVNNEMSPEMRKALADYTMRQETPAKGNYLPMNKSVSTGKQLG